MSNIAPLSAGEPVALGANKDHGVYPSSYRYWYLLTTRWNSALLACYDILDQKYWYKYEEISQVYPHLTGTNRLPLSIFLKYVIWHRRGTI